MNAVGTRTLHADLRADELRMVENAVRLAIDSIVNVLQGVNGARNAEYQRMVGDRDKKIQRLERRLKELEQELASAPPRHAGCPCRVTDRSSGPNGLDEAQVTAAPQQCEWIPPLSLSTTSLYSHKSSETTLSSESSGSGFMASRNLPPSPSGPVIKEEPCEIATVLIQTQMTEEDKEAGLTHHNGNLLGKELKLENQERTTVREQQHTIPDRQCISMGEQVRNKKRSMRMSELTEEAQRLKRAAWRAASRRYYARKIARQQAKQQNVRPFNHISGSQHSHLIPPVDVRGRMLMKARPLDSQTLHREAWRAASRR